jgi:hypothetical protein
VALSRFLAIPPRPQRHPPVAWGPRNPVFGAPSSCLPPGFSLHSGRVLLHPLRSLPDGLTPAKGNPQSTPFIPSGQPTAHDETDSRSSCVPCLTCLVLAPSTVQHALPRPIVGTPGLRVPPQPVICYLYYHPSLQCLLLSAGAFVDFHLTPEPHLPTRDCANDLIARHWNASFSPTARVELPVRNPETATMHTDDR